MIKLEKFLFFLMMMTVVSPSYFDSVPLFNFLVNISQIITIISIILITFFIRKTPSAFFFLQLLFYSYILIVTIYNDGALSPAILRLLRIISLILWIEYFINYDYMLSIMMLAFEIVIYANALTVFFLPINSAEFDYTYLMGGRNTHIQYLLVGVAISILCIFKRRHITRAYILIIISALSVFTVWSATAIVGLTFFLAACWFLRNFKASFFNARNLLFINFALFIGVVVLQLQKYLEFIIVDILKKSMTFSNRVDLWDKTIAFIKEKPIFGYGMEDGLVRKMKYMRTDGVNAHCQFLEYLYIGGAVLFVIFIIWNIVMMKKLMRHKNNYMAKVLSVCIFAIYIMMLTEAYSSMAIQLVFVLAYHVEKLISLETRSTLKPYKSRKLIWGRSN